MSRTSWILVALLLLGACGYLLVRTEGLARDLDALQRVQRLPNAAILRAGAPPAAPVSAPGPELVGSHAPPADEGRMDRLERQLEGLLGRLKQREASWEALEELVGELRGARQAANEAAAVATSRNVISALAQSQQSAKADEDQDGTGEYAGFLELSGAAAGRMAGVLVPPVLSRAFQVLNQNGEVLRNGYLYRIYLPDARGAGVGEPATGYRLGQVDPDLAETTWCVYAWPEQYGKTGTRTFFVNQGGDTLATDAPAYSGSGHGPDADAAFQPSHRGGIVGLPAVGGVGADGNVWKQVN